jgi:hypothetical protein
MDEINERTTYVLTISFYDEDNALVVPNTATYRIDDVTTGTAIKAKATCGAVMASSMDVAITTDQNNMVAENHTYETRRVTVEFTYGSGKRGTDEYLYKVRNLPGVSTVSSASASISASASRSASAS